MTEDARNTGDERDTADKPVKLHEAHLAKWAPRRLFFDGKRFEFRTSWMKGAGGTWQFK